VQNADILVPDITIVNRDETMLELYHAGLTACSKKTRLCLREKGIPYVSHFVNLKKFEQHKPDYLKLNPNGLVPTLVHDGVAIIESTVINEYIDEVFPEIPLRPEDAVGRARMRVWGKLADEALGPNMMVTFSGPGGIGNAARDLDDAALDKILAGYPLRDRREVVRKVVRGGGFSEAEFSASKEKAGFILDRAEHCLGEAKYLAGDSFSLADINMLPFIDRYQERVVPELVTPDRLPRLCAWLEEMMARPKVIETYAPSEETRPQEGAA
jgi:glutathione S-transferase